MSEIKPKQCFPSLFRLKTSQQIQNVLAYAKKLKNCNLSIFIKPNELDYPRLAIIIANKQVSKAVIRNRLKRIMRESFRLNQDKIRGNDIIIFGYKGIENLTNIELMKCLAKNWQKLNLFPKQL